MGTVATPLWAWISFLTSNLDSPIKQTTLSRAETTARWAKHVGTERAEEAVRAEDEVEAQAPGALRKEWTLTRRRQTRRSPPRKGNVSSPMHATPCTQSYGIGAYSRAVGGQSSCDHLRALPVMCRKPFAICRSRGLRVRQTRNPLNTDRSLPASISLTSLDPSAQGASRRPPA